MVEVDKINTKICSNCKEEKQLNDFHKNHVNPDGYAYRCKDCVKIYQKKHFSNPVIHDIKIQFKRKWNDENRVEKRKKDLDQKQKKQFDGRMLGTSNICQHLSKKFNGEFDFEREIIVIKRERNFVLSKGNKWFTFGAKGAVYQSDVRYSVKRPNDMPEIDNDASMLSSDAQLPIIPYVCPVCKKGLIVQLISPHSYEYNYDGVPIQFCFNCGFVVNWGNENTLTI